MQILLHSISSINMFCLFHLLVCTFLQRTKLTCAQTPAQCYTGGLHQINTGVKNEKALLCSWIFVGFEVGRLTGELWRWRRNSNRIPEADHTWACSAWMLSQAGGCWLDMFLLQVMDVFAHKSLEVQFESGTLPADRSWAWMEFWGLFLLNIQTSIHLFKSL